MNTVVVSWLQEVLRALSWKRPSAGLLRGGQNQPRLWGQQHGHTSTSQNERAPQEASQGGPLIQTDHRQLDSEHRHSGWVRLYPDKVQVAARVSPSANTFPRTFQKWILTTATAIKTGLKEGWKKTVM